MNKSANKKLIGLFVVVAFALFIGMFLLLSKGLFIDDSSKQVLYFEGSVKGLNIGSPVVFNGVPVGRVTNISLITDLKDMNFKIPVYIEESRNNFIILNSKDLDKKEKGYFLRKMIEKGLRAKLVSQSFVTGQMMIELGFYPDTPIVLHGDGTVEEIPTLPSSIEELSKTLQSLPLQETMKELYVTISELNYFFKTINTDTPKLMTDLKIITSSFASSSQKADKTLDLFSQNSKIVIDFNKMLKDFGSAALSFRNFADYLERHPEALLKGKQK